MLKRGEGAGDLGATIPSTVAQACQQTRDLGMKHEMCLEASRRPNQGAASSFGRGPVNWVWCKVGVLLLEAVPGLRGRWWPPASPATPLAQTLISSGVLFIMINAEMINGNANDGEGPQPSAPNIISAFPPVNRSLSPRRRRAARHVAARQDAPPSAAGRAREAPPPHMLLFIFCRVFVWQPEFQYISS